MSEHTKHTPGPWELDSNVIFGNKCDAEGNRYGICNVGGNAFKARAGYIGCLEDNYDAHDGPYVVSDTQLAEAEANGRLIAAAPALLAVVKKLVEAEPTVKTTAVYGPPREGSPIFQCVFCGGRKPAEGPSERSVVHAPDCAITLAVAALKAVEGED